MNESRIANTEARPIDSSRQARNGKPLLDRSESHKL